MEIRKSTEEDKSEIYKLHEQAFGEKEGPEVAELALGLIDDKTAIPILSLMATENNIIIGHILFTKAILTGTSESISVRILAPLGVLPNFQNKGVGNQLIKEGLARLKKSGVELVFVLGHPDYYPRSGFTPAGVLGLEAPFPIPVKDADAWMVQELKPGILGNVTGKIQCSEVLNQPELWRE